MPSRGYPDRQNGVILTNTVNLKLRNSEKDKIKAESSTF